MSNSELMGPKDSINRPSVFPDQSLGDSVSSSSTLSQGRMMHSTSYSRFSSNSCKAVMGRKGKNALAQTMERILPKLELAVILIYLSILVKVFRPSKIPCSSTPRSFCSSTTSAASLAASTAVSTEIPTLASQRAGISLMPSPKKPTVCPFCSKADTRRTFCPGVSSENTWTLSTAALSSLSVISSNSAPVSTVSEGMPTLRQIETATSV